MAHQDPTWTVIPDFQGHQINSSGEIRLIATGKVMRNSVNQNGVRYASMRNTTLAEYQNVAISVLVASTFCPGRSDNENTVLHFNGDTEDNRAENLMWAARWHAMQYHKEIRQTSDQTRQRIQDETGRIYKNVREAAMSTGCLPSAISYGVLYNDTLATDEHINLTHRVWPGGHTFRTSR